MLVLALMGLTMLVPLLLGVPIAVALGVSGLLWIVLLDPNFLRGAAYAVWNTGTNEVLACIPLFILMGEIVQRSGVSGRFYSAVAYWLRKLPGGLLHANLGACTLFSAISGSSVATAATIGTTALPHLTSLNYDRRLTLGSLAAGGTLGILIPPSVSLIIYALLTESSVGRLFAAALVPGLMMSAIFSGYILIRAWRDPSVAPSAPAPADNTKRLQSIIDTLPLFVMILVILGGIYLGWTTTTEAAALGVLMACAVSILEREFTWSKIRDAISAAVSTTAMLLFIVLGAQIFAFAIFSWGINKEVAEWIVSLGWSRMWILLIVMAIYLILGMFVDALSLMVLTLSVVFPIIEHLGFDPIWFGVVLVLLLEIGLITPPVGLNLYTIQAIEPGKITLGEVASGSFPFVLLLLLGIALLVMFPGLVLWLPAFLYAR